MLFGPVGLVLGVHADPGDHVGDGLDVSLDSCGTTTSVVRMDLIVFVLELVLMRFVRAMVTPYARIFSQL